MKSTLKILVSVTLTSMIISCTKKSDNVSENKPKEEGSRKPVIAAVTPRSPNSGGTQLYFDVQGQNFDGPNFQAELRPIAGGAAIPLTPSNLTATAGRLLISASATIAQGLFNLVISTAHGAAVVPVATLQGDTGIQGSIGLQGPQGIQGLQGIQGSQGIQGAAGPTYGPWKRWWEFSVISGVSASSVLGQEYYLDPVSVSQRISTVAENTSNLNSEKCQYRLQATAFVSETTVADAFEGVDGWKYNSKYYYPVATSLGLASNPNWVSSLTFDLSTMPTNYISAGVPATTRQRDMATMVFGSIGGAPDVVAYISRHLLLIKSNMNPVTLVTPAELLAMVTGKKAHFRLDARCLP